MGKASSAAAAPVKQRSRQKCMNSTRTYGCWIGSACAALGLFTVYLFMVSVLQVYAAAALFVLLNFGIAITHAIQANARKQNKWNAWHKALYSLYLVALSVMSLWATLALFEIWLFPQADLQMHALRAPTSHSMTVWARSNAFAHFLVEYKIPSQREWRRTSAVAFQAESDFIGILQITELSPHTVYDYRIVHLDTEKNEVVDQNIDQFATLPLEGQHADYRFIFTSCSMKAARWGYQLKGFSRLLDRRPLFTIFLGDLIYTDVPLQFIGLGSNIANYHAKYRQTFIDKYFQEYSRKISTFYMYDDHEVINDYVDAPETPMFQAALRGWMNYAGGTNPHPYGNELATQQYHFEAGDVSYFIFEVHYDRTDHDGNMDNAKIIGEQQMQQAKEWLQNVKSRFTFKILASPSPWTLKYGSNGWSGYRKQRDELMDYIKDNDIRGCLFISGDAHSSGVFKMKHDLIEVSASPVSSGRPPFSTFPRQEDSFIYEQPEFSFSEGSQYGVIDVKMSTDEPHLDILLYGDTGHSLWLNMSYFANGTYQIVHATKKGEMPLDHAVKVGL